MARTPPTLVAFQQTSTWQSASTPKSIGSALTWLTGDVIVVVAASEDTSIVVTTPTVTGLTFTAIGTANVASDSTYLHRWVATAASDGSGTVSIGRSGSTGNFGGAVWQYRDSDGIGTAPATSTAVNVKTISLVESQDNSAVIVMLSDWGAGSVTVTWTPTGQTGRVADSGGGTTYSTVAADWADAGTATTTSYGVTAGLSNTQKIAKAVIEVLGMETGGGDEVFGDAVLTGESSLTATALVTQLASSVLTGQSSLTASATNSTTGESALSGQSSLTVTGSVTTSGQATLTGESSLSALGSNNALATSTLSGQSELTVVATNSTTGSVSLTGESDLTAIGNVGGLPTTVSLSSESTLTVTGTVTQIATATLTGQSDLTADSSVEVYATSVLSGQSDLTASGDVAGTNSASLSGESSLTVSATVTQFGSSVLSGQSNLDAFALNTVPGVVTLSVQSSIVIIGTRGVTGAAQLSGQSDLQVDGYIPSIVDGAVQLSASMSLDVIGRVNPPWTFTLIEFSDTTISITTEVLTTASENVEVASTSTSIEGG